MKPISNVKPARTCLLGVLLTTIAGVSFAATPKTMQAVVQTGSGGPQVLALRTVPVPTPGPKQVLIRIYAAAINPVDWKIRSGEFGAPPPGAPPAPVERILGLDVAGVVAAVGPEVTDLKVGDPVFSMIGMDKVPGLNGGYAEYAVADATDVVHKPARLTYGEASGLGVAGITAVRVLHALNLARGQRVLITGVAGGVGSAFAQILHAQGLYVIGTGSAAHREFAKSLGVDRFIDYTQGRFEAQTGIVDAAIDCVGGETAERALGTVKRGGAYATIAANIAPEKCTPGAIRCVGDGRPGGKGPMEGALLSEVAALVEAGQYSVHVDKTFPLSDAAQAQEYNRAGHTAGKVILAVKSDAVNRR